MKDSIDISYKKITPFFYWFSKLCESKARAKSLELSGIKNSNSILIIAPATEYYIDTLLEVNSNGKNYLFYFSENQKQRADKKLAGKYSYFANVGSFKKLPYNNNKFDAVFAYCYFDFLDYEDRKIAAKEVERVLKTDGKLLASYLASPTNFIEKISAYFLTKINFLARGVRVIDPEPILKQTNFKNIKTVHCPQKGFPIALVYAEK